MTIVARNTRCDAPDPNTSYFTADGAFLGKRINGVIPTPSPILAATLSTINTQSILTGILRLWSLIVAVKEVNAKPKVDSKDETSMRKTASKITDTTQNVRLALVAGQTAAEIGGGVVGTIYAGFSIAAITTASKTAAVAAQSLGQASSGLGLALYTFMAIIGGVKAAKALKIVNDKGLKDGLTAVPTLQKLYETQSADLKLVAPKVFAAIEKNNGLVCRADIKAVIKEAKGTATLSIVVISACVLSIVATALGLAFSAGPLVIVTAIISLIAGLTMTSIDGYSMINYLKETSHLSKKDLVVKIIVIILAAITLAVTIAFTAAVALKVIGVIIGIIMIAIPIISIAVLKAKEERSKKLELEAHEAEKKRIKKVEQEEFFDVLKPLAENYREEQGKRRAKSF